MTVELKTRVSLPEIFEQFIEAIQGYAAVTGIHGDHLDVTFTADNEFDLGVTVTELQHELNTLVMENVSITKIKEKPKNPSFEMFTAEADEAVFETATEVATKFATFPIDRKVELVQELAPQPLCAEVTDTAVREALYDFFERK